MSLHLPSCACLILHILRLFFIILKIKMPVAKKRVKANSMAPLVRKKCTKTIRESPKPFCSYTMESLLFKWQSNEVWGNVHIIASHIKVSYFRSQDLYTETVMVKINMDCQNIKLNATKQAPQTMQFIPL